MCALSAAAIAAAIEEARRGRLDAILLWRLLRLFLMMLLLCRRCFLVVSAGQRQRLSYKGYTHRLVGGNRCGCGRTKFYSVPGN